MPEPSVTVHVTTVVSPIGYVAGALFVTLATEQLSPVVGAVKLTPLAVQLPASVFTVYWPGAVIVGFILSVTVTFWVPVAVLPEPSVTVHVTVVSPIGKAEGHHWLPMPQCSCLLSPASKVTPVAVQPVMVVTSTSTDTVIVGFILSVTVTFWVAVAVLPEPSVTVHVTVVSPIGKTVGHHCLPKPQSSCLLSPASKVTPVAVQPVTVVTSTSAGAVIVGFILSVTVTFWVPVAVLPEPSVTVHVTVVSPSWKAEGASLLTEQQNSCLLLPAFQG